MAQGVSDTARVKHISGQVALACIAWLAVERRAERRQRRGLTQCEIKNLVYDRKSEEIRQGIGGYGSKAHD